MQLYIEPMVIKVNIMLLSNPYMQGIKRIKVGLMCQSFTFWLSSFISFHPLFLLLCWTKINSQTALDEISQWNSAPCDYLRLVQLHISDKRMAKLSEHGQNSCGSIDHHRPWTEAEQFLQCLRIQLCQSYLFIHLFCFYFLWHNNVSSGFDYVNYPNSIFLFPFIPLNKSVLLAPDLARDWIQTFTSCASSPTAHSLHIKNQLIS